MPIESETIYTATCSKCGARASAPEYRRLPPEWVRVEVRSIDLNIAIQGGTALCSVDLDYCPSCANYVREDPVVKLAAKVADEEREKQATKDQSGGGKR